MRHPGICGFLFAAGIAAASGTVAEEVRQQLTALPYYVVFDDLGFALDHGRVALSGEVTEPGVKNAAQEAVEKIPGIGPVENRIEVLPASSRDQRLRLQVYAATYGQPVLQPYQARAVPPVHIIVKNANVTLEGIVENQMDKTAFFTQASAVPGVVSVTIFACRHEVRVVEQSTDDAFPSKDRPTNARRCSPGSVSRGLCNNLHCIGRCRCKMDSGAVLPSVRAFKEILMRRLFRTDAFSIIFVHSVSRPGSGAASAGSTS